MKLNPQNSCSGFDSLPLSERKITGEGFLEAPARLARTGVQVYTAGQLGLTGMDSSTIVRLYRGPEELFAPDTIASFEGQPVTIEHPKALVTADTWKDVAVGDVRKIARDGETMSGVVTVRDKKAIKEVDAGRKYLSNLYKFTLDPTPGVAGDGQEYDGIQRNIRGNSVAITKTPRGGYSLTIADSKENSKVKVMVDGIAVEVGDTEGAVLAKFVDKSSTDSTALSTLNKLRIKVGDKEFGVGDSALQPAITALEATNKDLTSKVLTPEQLNTRIASRVALVGDSAAVAPDFKVAATATDVDIYRGALTAVLAKDSTAKTVVTAIMAGRQLNDLDEPTLATALRAAKAAAGTTAGRSTVAADSAVASALTDTSGAGVRKDAPLAGREAWLAASAKANSAVAAS